MAAPSECRIFTIGHSTRSLDEFIALLNAHAVSCLTDVRTVPRSRHNPQYNMESLAASMSDVGVRYAHVPELGGFRRAKPDSPGTELCRQLKSADRTRRVPIVMISARGEEIDRVVGFEVGADDYVVKPYSVRELILRIRALLRRSHRVEGEPSLIRFGRLKIDRDAHRAWVDDAEIGLTALEFRLLHAFLSRRGRVQTRDALLSDVWGIEADVTTRTVDTHVKRLREKLGAAGKYVETVRGAGYRFRGDPDVPAGDPDDEA